MPVFFVTLCWLLIQNMECPLVYLRFTFGIGYGINKINANVKKKLEITEKESYRWIASAHQTKRLLSETSLLTIIGDREADIYEEFAIVPDKKTHLLIRSSWDRNLYGSKQRLFETLASSKEKACYDLSLKGNKGRKKRVAKMSLRFTKVQVQKPQYRKLSNYPDYITMWAIQAKESKKSTPKGENPILWRLLTTHKIDYFEDAEKCIEWYKERWLIEELFRVIKSKGLEIESSQLETGAGLKKLAVMALQVGLNTMVLRLSLKNPNELKAGVAFTEAEKQFMEVLIKTLEGKTEKQKNPYTKHTLAWAAWGIARLSGWSGYKSHGPPGYISIKIGLNIFQNKYEGFKMALNILKNKDVYKD